MDEISLGVTMLKIKNVRNFSRLKLNSIEMPKAFENVVCIFLLIKIVQSLKINCDSTRKCMRRWTKEPHKNVFLLTHSKGLSLLLSANLADSIKPPWNRFELGDSLSNVYFKLIRQHYWKISIAIQSAVLSICITNFEIVCNLMDLTMHEERSKSLSWKFDQILTQS